MKTTKLNRPKQMKMMTTSQFQRNTKQQMEYFKVVDNVSIKAKLFKK